MRLALIANTWKIVALLTPPPSPQALMFRKKPKRIAVGIRERIYRHFTLVHISTKTTVRPSSNVNRSYSVTNPDNNIYHYSDWVCTAVMSNDVVKDLRG